MTSRRAVIPNLASASRWARVVLIFSGVLGMALTFLTTALFARTMLAEAFEAYASISALYLVLVASAPMGGEKLALRVVPPFRAAGEWRMVRAFLGFALRRGAFGWLIVAMLFLAAIILGGGAAPGTSANLLVYVLLALPIGIIASICLEMLTALGRPTLASFAFRGLPPATVLGLFLLGSLWQIELTAFLALAAWGLGWGLAALVLGGTIARSIGPAAAVQAPDAAQARGQAKAWTRAARPLWGYKAGISLMGGMGIVFLDLQHLPAADIGAFAAATAVAGLMSVLASSTNRLYAVLSAEQVEAGSNTGLRILSNARMKWIVPCTLAGFLLILVFPDPILRLFGPGFPEDGRTALRVLTAAVSVSIVFAMNPITLKHRFNHSALLAGVVLAVAVQFAALLICVPLLGSSGAAWAYFAGTVALHGFYALAVRKPAQAL